MDFNPAKIQKEFYSKPIYISSRITTMAIEFVPKGSQPVVRRYIGEHFSPYVQREGSFTKVLIEGAAKKEEEL